MDLKSMNLTLLSWRIQFVESGRHCHLHAFTCHERNISFATTSSDSAVAHTTWYLSSCNKRLVLANFFFSLRDINLTFGLLPLRGHVVWRDSVGVESSRSELKSECADIFHQSSLWFSYAILTSPKEGETAVYGYNPALFWVLSVSCWCLAESTFT